LGSNTISPVTPRYRSRPYRRVADAAAVQARAADRVQQDVHGVEAERGETRPPSPDSAPRSASGNPATCRIVAIGIERVDDLQPFGASPALANSVVAQYAEAAEDRLFHAHLLHLFEDRAGRGRIGPQITMPSTRESLITCNCTRKARVPGMYFCSITTGWPSRREASRNLTRLRNGRTAR
jgi:hypothetical protein